LRALGTLELITIFSDHLIDDRALKAPIR